MNFLLAAVAAFELQLPIMCGPTDSMMQSLRKEYSEQIIFMSPSENEKGELLTHTLWVNGDTQTWSFVVANKEKQTSCVIASGYNYLLMEEPTI